MAAREKPDVAQSGDLRRLDARRPATQALGHGSRYTWVIDPVDGTSNFAAGLPHYGVMIGLLDGATPIAGGIALPAFGEICNGAPIHARPVRTWPTASAPTGSTPTPTPQTSPPATLPRPPHSSP